MDENQLFFDGQAYRCQLVVIDGSAEGSSTAEVKVEQPVRNLQRDSFALEITPDLNYRQIQTIKDKQLDNISVKNYSDEFEVTTMTALRDLKKLCEMGYLKKTGRARSTRYMKLFKT